MSLAREAHIELVDGQFTALLAWEGFDGDDCFQVHYITVTGAEMPRRFEFGPCVVWGLRKLDRFVQGLSEPHVSSGFRNPDIRYWDLFREGDHYTLLIRFPEQALAFEQRLTRPQIHNDRRFIQEYDGEET